MALAGVAIAVAAVAGERVAIAAAEAQTKVILLKWIEKAVPEAPVLT